MANRVDFHAQLANLLGNAQLLVEESSSSFLNSNNGYNDLGRYGGGSRSRLSVFSLVAMQAEISTLEFWRSILAECLATFLYVLIVCSVTTSSDEQSLQVNSALASGLAAATLTLAFARVSGAHLNPAVTSAMMVARQISPLRSLLYISAQCGGGIAGAALVRVVFKRLKDPALKPESGAFGMEFVLTFLVSYAFCSSRADARLSFNQYRSYNSYQKSSGPYGSAPSSVISVSSARPEPLMIGVAYAGCLLAWKGCLNPARALGSAFVFKDQGSFHQHWIFWAGPLLGAVSGGFTFEYIFSVRQKNASWADGSFSHVGTNGILNTAGGTSAGMQHSAVVTMSQPYVGRSGLGNEVAVTMQHQDDLDMMDDLERAKQYKANITQDFSDRQSTSASMYASNVGRQPYGKSVGARSIYEDGTSAGVYGVSKSLYNQPIGGGYGDGGKTSLYGGGGGGTKSLYGGYDGMTRNGASNLRRSRSIHAKLPPKRNPYDYLPDEPQTMLTESLVSTNAGTMVGNKPDIMQSVGNGGPTNGRGLGTKTALNSPGSRYGGTTTGSQHYHSDLEGSYVNGKIDRYGSDPYRNTYRERAHRMKEGPLASGAVASGSYDAYGKRRMHAPSGMDGDYTASYQDPSTK